MGNGRVFISHSHDDNVLVMPLLTALDAWGIDYWFDVQGLSAGQRLDERIQREMATRDVFLRVCTGALQRSFWSSLEVTAFRGLQADDRQKGRSDRRLLINVILDRDYQREPFDGATTYIDAVNMSRSAWMGELRRALGVASSTTTRGVSRRAALGFGAAAVVAVSSTAAAAAFLLDYKSRTSTPAQPTYGPGKHIWEMSKLATKKDIPDPAVYGNRLYVTTGDTVAAYDLANDRKRLWSNSYSPLFEFTTVVVLDGAIYYSIDDKLYAASADSGKVKWTAQTEETGSEYATSPAVDAHGTYIYASSGKLYSYATGSGELRWSSAVVAPVLDDDLPSGPVIAGSAVVIGSADHNVYAFGASDGSLRWKFLTRGKVLSTPAYTNGVIYVGSNDGYVYALNASDGSLKWKYLTQDAVRSSPAILDGVVFVGSNDQYLYALDAETGDPYWRAPSGDLDTSTGIIESGGAITGWPAATPEAVCVLVQGAHIVRCYERSDGTLRWSYKSADQYQNADPIAASGLIFFGSGDNNLYAFGV